MVKEIRKRAEEKGITIAELERAAGLGRSTVLRWDRATPSVDKVKSAADVLGCTVDDLIREEAQA